MGGRQTKQQVLAAFAGRTDDDGILRLAISNGVCRRVRALAEIVLECGRDVRCNLGKEGALFISEVTFRQARVLQNLPSAYPPFDLTPATHRRTNIRATRSIA